MKKTIFLLIAFFGIYLSGFANADRTRVIFSEIMYDSPLNEQIATGSAYSNGEFIELYNPGNNVDLSGWSLRGDGSTEAFTFPEGTTIMAQSYLIVAYQYIDSGFQMDSLFSISDADKTKIIYQRKVILANGGETITLLNWVGEVQDQITFDGTSNKTKPDRLSAENANGTAGMECLSLQRRSVVFDNNDCAVADNSHWITDKVTPFTQSIEILPDIDRDLAQHNYVRTTVYRSAGGSTYNHRTQHFDGLGYPTEFVETGITPSGRSIVTLAEYDIHGRQVKTWLPMPTFYLDGRYVKTEFLKATAKQYFSDDNPYTETCYEVNTLDRVSQRYNVGSVFHKKDKVVQASYDTNVANEVKQFIANLVNEEVVIGTYPAGQLRKTNIKNEDESTTCTYTDKAGRVVLTRIINGTENVDTYYGYDDFGRLTAIITPEGTATIATQALTSFGLNSHFADSHCYIYRFDASGNLCERHFPGGVREQFRYDSRNRLVRHYRGHMDYDLGSSIGVQYPELYTYDHQNRVQNVWVICNTITTSIYDPTVYYDVNVTDSISNRPGPISFQPIFKYRYDTYADVPQALSYVPVTMPSGVGPANKDYDRRTKGLKTYEKIRVLGKLCQIEETAEFTERAFYYDSDGRLLQQVERNHKGGISRFSYGYDFVGNLIYKKEQHQPVSGAFTDALSVQYVYDYAGRLLKETTTLNNSSALTTSYLYNDLGQLEKKESGSFKETYKYNLQGWLTESKSNYSTTALRYYNPKYGTTGSYSGNIAEWDWTQTGAGLNTYGYTYDALSRVTNTQQYINGQADNQYVEQGITYDKNGNLKTLKRYAAGTLSEDLSYRYFGGRLCEVSRAGYTYDHCGNIAHDGRKRLDISYNFLNLPCLIQYPEDAVLNPSDDVLIYEYLSDGTKFSRTDQNGSGLMYVGSLVYTLSSGTAPRLESTGFGCGRILATNSGSGVTYTPQYHVTDHLGSTRVVTDGTAANTVTYNYYPFGSEWTSADTRISDNRYVFNGKEKQILGTANYLDYGARFYDPNIGRWTTQDPLAEKYYSISPYAYCANNPVKFIDPDGRKIYFAPSVSREFKDKFARTVQYMNKRGTAGDMVALEASDNVYYITEGDAEFNITNNTISWSPNQVVKTSNGILLLPATILAHEAKHGRQKNDMSKKDFDEKRQKDNRNPYGNELERDVITTTEQNAAKKHGDIGENETTRANHEGVIIEISTPIPEEKILEDYRPLLKQKLL